MTPEHQDPEHQDPEHKDSVPADPAVASPASVPVRGGWGGWTAWSAEQQAEIDKRECTDARCMNVDVNVGYQGLVENSVLSQAAAVGDELRTAWQRKLRGEGKLNPTARSLRETILGGVPDRER